MKQINTEAFLLFLSYNILVSQIMDMQQNSGIQTVEYSGVFLSCFSDYSEKCIHATPEHVLVYLYSGEQIIEDGDKTITLVAGDCAFIRRDHRLKMYKNSKGEDLYKGISLTFKRNVLREFYTTINKSEIPTNITISDKKVFNLQPSPALESLFQSLTPYFNNKVKPTESIVHLKLLEGIYTLLNTDKLLYSILFDFTEPWKIDLLKFLNENYMEDLTMKQLASYTGRSLATFKRDFKKLSELTPQKWLIKKRLEMAYMKLKEEKVKVQDVYSYVGFKNPSHFSTAFKKQYGVSPSDI